MYFLNFIHCTVLTDELVPFICALFIDEVSIFGLISNSLAAVDRENEILFISLLFYLTINHKLNPIFFVSIQFQSMIPHLQNIPKQLMATMMIATALQQILFIFTTGN